MWLALLAVAGVTGYSRLSDYSERARRRERDLLSPAEGERCTVVLRGDVLRLAQAPPRAARVGGVDNFVEGRFAMMNDQWVKLSGARDGEPQQWIPRENVLLIQVTDP